MAWTVASVSTHADRSVEVDSAGSRVVNSSYDSKGMVSDSENFGV